MFELIRANKRRSVLLIAGFVLITVAVAARPPATSPGWAGPAPWIALVIAGGVGFASYWKADFDRPRRQPGPACRSRAVPAPAQVVEGLCIAGGLPKPRVYVIDDPAPNAFATGRNPKHTAIAVTTGCSRR